MKCDRHISFQRNCFLGSVQITISLAYLNAIFYINWNMPRLSVSARLLNLIKKHHNQIFIWV